MNIVEYEKCVQDLFVNHVHVDVPSFELLANLNLRMKKWISTMVDQQTFYVWNTPYNRDLIGAAINTCLSIMEELVPKMKDDPFQVCKELCELAKSKNADYSVFNIISTGHLGLCIRILDKINRCHNLIGEPGKAQVNEKLDETIRDVFNYLVYFKLILNGKWMTDDEKHLYGIKKTIETELGLFVRFLDDDKLISTNE